mgnify:CR=1 FL=1
MKVAPIGAFGAMAFTIGNFGVGTLLAAGQADGVLLSDVPAVRVRRPRRDRAVARVRYLAVREIRRRGDSDRVRDVFVGSGAPAGDGEAGKARCNRSIVGVVVPAGYSFNLDGTAIYLAMATVFIAQATGTSLGPGRQLALLALLLITSKGSAGVAGAALIALAGTLSATTYPPVAGVALVLGIHRFMGEAMAATNLVGNGVAAIVIGKWCGQVD